jgi:WD40 repeat protein
VEDLNCVIAGSLDKLISITDAEERVRLKVLDGHMKGVTSVDWSPIYKFVCSGAQDRKIILWNPFSQRPLAQLTGHATSVQQVLVNDKDNQIISLGSDKTVKVRGS